MQACYCNDGCHDPSALQGRTLSVGSTFSLIPLALLRALQQRSANLLSSAVIIRSLSVRRSGEARSHLYRSTFVARSRQYRFSCNSLQNRKTIGPYVNLSNFSPFLQHSSQTCIANLKCYFTSAAIYRYMSASMPPAAPTAAFFIDRHCGIWKSLP